MNERRVIGWYREAIRLFDTDRQEAYHVYYKSAYNANGPWRTDQFNALEQDILKIWRAFWPQKRGHYKTVHIAVGYSSFPVQRWVDDKVQPPRQTVEEALEKFDVLVAPWVRSIVEKLEK